VTGTPPSSNALKAHAVVGTQVIGQQSFSEEQGILPMPSGDNQELCYDRHYLSSEQKQILVEVLYEQAGPSADFSAFSIGVFKLFEDIPGFELDFPSEALVRDLWEIYIRLARHNR
jgi:hypothetical protein